jgi:CopG family transcriptional regulator, nickel-responsive regulator
MKPARVAGQELVRFGVAMEARLIDQLDALAEQRGSTRSELLRDLARAEVVRGLVQKRVPAVAAVTIVYDHHVRELSERLNAIQHELEDQVRSTMHVHLDHDHCLEVIVMRGRSDLLKNASDRLLGTRGVTHGGVEIIAESALATAQGEPHAREHSHGHEHPHTHAPARAAKRGRAKR